MKKKSLVLQVTQAAVNGLIRRGHSGLLVPVALALAVSASVNAAEPLQSLPSRGTVLIEHAHIVTMDAAGDLPDSDILVRDGKIAAIGTALKRPADANIIDASGMIVMPGLVDTHWHMWNTLLRGMEGTKSGEGYFDIVHRSAGPRFTPDDSYLGVALAGAEAIDAGITFVHDWSHNVRSPAHARAELRALDELGLGARYSYGYHTTMVPSESAGLDDVAELQRSWERYANGGLVDLGVALRGPLPGIPDNVWQGEIKRARALGLPMTMHVNQSTKNSGMVRRLCDGGFLGRDLLLIHAIDLAQGELDCIVMSGTPVSISPESEMRVGYGFPPLEDMLAKNVRLGLSIDTVSITGTGSLFSVMRTTQIMAAGLERNEFPVTARRLLTMATIGGAEAMGLDRITGSLKVGKRADLIMIDPRAANLIPISDIANTLVQAVQPANISLVMVDGRVLKRDGKLTAIDLGALKVAAQRRNTELLPQASDSKP